METIRGLLASERAHDTVPPMDLALLLALLDCWIETFEAWRGTLRSHGENAQKAEKLAAELEEAVKTAKSKPEVERAALVYGPLLACLTHSVPAPPRLVEKALWIVGLKLGDEDLNIYDLFYQRTVRSRLDILDSMLRHHADEVPFADVPMTDPNVPQLAWMADREATLCKTVTEKNYVEQLRDEPKRYAPLISRALGINARDAPIASIVELSMCNLWALAEELCKYALKVQHHELFMPQTDLSKLVACGLGSWWGVAGDIDVHPDVEAGVFLRPPSPTTSRRRMMAQPETSPAPSSAPQKVVPQKSVPQMVVPQARPRPLTEADVLRRDRIFCEALLALMKPHLGEAAFTFITAFMGRRIYFKHASENEAAVHAMGLGAPNVMGQKSAFTAGSEGLNVDFGHLDYVFGRLEMQGGDHTGSTRYGDYHFCIDLDHLGPQICITLHDQGMPFSKPELATSSWGSNKVRNAYQRSQGTGSGPLNCKEIGKTWECHYPRSDLRVPVSFLHEIFFGPCGIRLGLALSLACEFTRAGLTVPQLPTSAEGCNDLLKPFFRPQILCPCMLHLDHTEITTPGVKRIAHPITLQERTFARAQDVDAHIRRQVEVLGILCQKLMKLDVSLTDSVTQLMGLAAMKAPPEKCEQRTFLFQKFKLESTGDDVKRLIGAVISKYILIWQMKTKGATQLVWKVLQPEPEDEPQ